MKILVLNGSPKRDKSDTLHITRAFLDGMNDAAPQDTEIIHVIDKHIEYCTGCFACKRNGGTCIHRDDMREILEKILDSDLLLLSYPGDAEGRRPVRARRPGGLQPPALHDDLRLRLPEQQA